MPSTPARAAREEERREQSMETARAANELKYTEFQLNCDAGSVGACTSLGEWLELMRGDTLAAVALYRPACFEKRYPQACYNFGKALGKTTAASSPTPAEARNAYVIACEGGNADACSAVGRTLLREALEAQAPAAPAAAGGAAEKAGSSGASASPQSTSAVGGSGAAAAHPPAAPPALTPRARASLEEATVHLARGCESGVSASHGNCCQLLAQLRFDERLPLPLAARRVSPAAPAPGEPATVDARSLTGVELLARACEGENARACTSLAKLYRFGDERLGVTPDATRSAMYARRRLVLGGMSEAQADRKVALIFKDGSKALS